MQKGRMQESNRRWKIRVMERRRVDKEGKGKVEDERKVKRKDKKATGLEVRVRLIWWRGKRWKRRGVELEDERKSGTRKMEAGKENTWKKEEWRKVTEWEIKVMAR